MTTTSTKLAALALVAMLPLTGCLGLFGGDDGGNAANATSLNQSVGEETARQIEERSSGQFKNFTIPGQEALEGTVQWFNGSIGPGPTVASQEDRNDRSGTNYNTEIVKQDISDALPAGQPAEIRLKLWYLPGPGQSGDLDLYVNVPGEKTEWAGDDCDAFSWKVCVQEKVVNTVGKDGAPAEVGVQVSNNRAFQGMEYFLKMEVTYAKDVVTPAAPYAFDVPENATGLVIKSEKAGGGEHIVGELLVIGPDDELVEHVTYNDIAIPTESKLIPVSEPGEYIIYPLELHGGFLSVEADVPVDKDKLQGRQLEMTTDTVEDASGPTNAGVGCVPIPIHDAAPRNGDCRNATWNGGGSTAFSVDGTFPLEVSAWINAEGSQNANVDAEVRIKSPNGIVFFAQKFLQYEDGSGTIGSSRDEINFESFYENLAKGEYTIEYIIDGSAAVGHTVKSYTR